MIAHPSFRVEPWSIHETTFDLDVISQTESLFALSNGHIGLRGNLDEGEPHGLPGTYLNGFYELQPLPYAEAGYGYPESGQTLINVTNGKLIRLLVDDEPFDLRYGDLLDHTRTLDLRAGTLEREVRWRSPAGRSICIRSTRLVSLTQRSVAAIAYEVEALDADTRVVVQSELVANEAPPATDGDPRVAAALDAPLQSELHFAEGLRAWLMHVTRSSGLRVAAGMDHVLTRGTDGGADSEADVRVDTETESRPDLARVAFTTLLHQGQRLGLVKFLTYGWSLDRSPPALVDQVAAALLAARQTGWEKLLAEQRGYLDEFWERADVQVEGNSEMQQAVRFALFHVLQGAARAERRAIPAKALTGPGYDGHSFWDTETFVLPVLTYTESGAVADALRWRQSTLPLALERASQLGLRGAAFPWRTIDGHECSAYWPAGTGAFHVNADIADAVIRYVNVTGDAEFERDTGVEILIQTARLWHSLGHLHVDGRFRIDGVTGPDEYSAIADNNVYTNLMAQRNLVAAADATMRHPDRARELGVGAEELAIWRAAANVMSVPYDETMGVHPQAEGFTRHQAWDFASTRADQYPLFLHFPYFDLYRKQVVKQADLVLALHLCGDAFTPEEKARNFAYYEARTVRDSSLSACTQAVVAAEVGQLDLAYAYLQEAALIDLDDLQHNTRDGLHLASLAGSWIALVAGLGGLRDHGGLFAFSPRLPTELTRVAFTLCIHHSRLSVEIRQTGATYSLVNGSELTISHDGESLTLTPGQAMTRPLPSIQAGPPPFQPEGREPRLG